MIQCEHELLLKKGFELDMYDKRWYNDFTYNEVTDYVAVPTQMDVLPVGQSNNFISTSDTYDCDINMDYGDDVDDMGDNLSATPDTSSEKNILSFSSVLSYCKRVVSTIQNNKTQMAKLLTALECIL